VQPNLEWLNRRISTSGLRQHGSIDFEHTAIGKKPAYTRQ
jgi:hypothetical protein